VRIAGSPPEVDANAQTAVLRNQVIGTQTADILRAPTRLFESAMGNLVADAMRAKYPGIDAAFTNSGGLRADLRYSPPAAGEQVGEITWGEMFAVLPFGNRTVIETLTGGDGYTAFTQGTNVLQPGDALLDVAIEYVAAHSPVAPAVEGRIVGP
jgi:2',3'-cyclic-nucleotide 2'-phosphodiesterase (5'-nucleotidase family)